METGRLVRATIAVEEIDTGILLSRAVFPKLRERDIRFDIDYGRDDDWPWWSPNGRRPMFHMPIPDVTLKLGQPMEGYVIQVPGGLG